MRSFTNSKNIYFSRSVSLSVPFAMRDAAPCCLCVILEEELNCFLHAKKKAKKSLLALFSQTRSFPPYFDNGCFPSALGLNPLFRQRYRQGKKTKFAFPEFFFASHASSYMCTTLALETILLRKMSFFPDWPRILLALTMLIITCQATEVSSGILSLASPRNFSFSAVNK